MQKKLLLLATLLFTISCNGQENRKTFSPTISENEKHLSAILDTLDNEYYWQQIPEDRMGQIPVGHQGYGNKYPFRTKRNQLLEDIKIGLEKPLSENYLLKLYDTKHTLKIGEHYKTIAEKLISFHSDSTNLKLWNIAIAKVETDRQYLYDNLSAYVIREFVSNNILKDKTRAYIVQNKDFKTQYFGHFDKEIDLKIIDAEIAKLQTQIKEGYLANASNHAQYLFINNGLLPQYDAPINFRDWYQAKYYYRKVEQGSKLSYVDFDWDNDDDKKNVDLTIRFLNAIKENYDEINEEYKLKTQLKSD